MITTSFLALKSEIVLAAQLVARHRAPRLTMLLAAAVVTFLVIQGHAAACGGSNLAAVLLICGVFGSVAGSRPLAPGAALASAYRAAASWWLVPTGRLGGVLLLTLPVVAVASVVLCADALTAWSVSLVVGLTVYPASLASLVLAASPLIGASAAATLGFVTAWFGMASPAAVTALLQKWPVLQGAATLVWTWLPMGWRVERWIRGGSVADIVLPAVWLVLGIAAAAWSIPAAYRSHRPPQAAIA